MMFIRIALILKIQIQMKIQGKEKSGEVTSSTNYSLVAEQLWSLLDVETFHKISIHNISPVKVIKQLARKVCKFTSAI